MEEGFTRVVPPAKLSHAENNSVNNLESQRLFIIKVVNQMFFPKGKKNRVLQLNNNVLNLNEKGGNKRSLRVSRFCFGKVTANPTVT